MCLRLVCMFALGLLACSPSKPRADAPASAPAIAESAPPLRAAPASRAPGVKPHFVPCDPAHPERPCTPEQPPLELRPANTVSALFDGVPEATLRACKADADCRLTCRQDGDCCPSLCTCDTPYNAASFDRLKAHQAACTHRGCPKAKCKDPGHSLAPVCVEGLCTSKKVPYPAE